MQDPILGVTALRRVGVNFNEAQTEVIRNLVETGNAAEAQRLILKELNTEFGGSATEKASQFGGQIEQLGNLIGDLNEAIGNSLVPIIQSVVEKLKPIVEKTIEWIEKNPKLTATILILGGAISALVAAIGVLGLLLPGILTGLSALSAAFTALVASSGPIGLVILGISALRS